MAKGVLGNDPFQRGAASRPTQAEPELTPSEGTPPSPVPRATDNAHSKKTASGKTRASRKAGSRPQPPIAAPRPRQANPALAEALDHALGSPRTPPVPAAPARAQGPVAHPDSPVAVEIRPPRELVRVHDDSPPRRAPHSPEPHPLLQAVASVRQLFGQARDNQRVQLARQLLGGSTRALLTGLGAGGSVSLDDFGKDVSLAHQLSPIADLLCHRYWRVGVQGAERVPTGPAILVANHSGAIPVDGPVLHHALSRARADLAESRWLVEDQVFHAPFLGVLLNRLGAVRANPENALRLLEEGRPVIVFPEGVQGIGKPFRERYQLKRFGRGGFVKLARQSGAPIVPVAIVGAEETAPLLGKLPGRFLGLPYLPVTSPIPLPARWAIRFGEPLDAGRGAEDLAEIQRLTERTRESIQNMLQTLLRERGPVFAGPTLGAEPSQPAAAL